MREGMMTNIIRNRSFTIKINTIYNLLHKYQTRILGLGILVSFTAVSFHFDGKKVESFWQDSPIVAAFLLGIGFFCLYIYIRLDKYKIQQLSKEIEYNSRPANSSVETSLTSLTERQRKVYDLIISGKSNKEIIGQLFIEQSTLKSHINQIYKKLDFKSRAELKAHSGK